MDFALAAKLGAHSNLVHGFVYFAPELADANAALGLEGHQAYFASRAAALGAVPAEVVVATFFNFNPRVVHEAIPAAWSVADPATIQRERMRVAGDILARDASQVADEDVEEAAALAGRMIDGVGLEGKPLAAANSAVPEPDDRWARLWQRISVIREWRGDAHVAALTVAPVDAVEALVLHAATGQVPKDGLMATRRWSAEDWDAAVERLGARGLVEPEGSFTDAGREFRDAIERQTDEACLRLVNAVGETDTVRLLDLLRPIRKALLDAGAFALAGR